MQKRRIEGLKSAERYDGALPFALPKPKRACGLAGLRYERAVAKRTEGLVSQWWKFEDRAGEGFCQTDIVLLLDGFAAVIEVKLTEVGSARRELRELYIPVVEMALAKPTKGIVVCRHLSKETDTYMLRDSLHLALKCATRSYFPTVHWIGRGPI